MKRIMALFCIVVVTVCIFAGCNNKASDNKELFYKFMDGEITALDDDGEEKQLDGGFAEILSDKYNYCFIDMNGDGEEELCVKNPYNDFLFFTVKKGKLYHWYTTNHNYNEELTLLNNGAFLFKEVTARKDGVKYRYCKLDENGNEKIITEFSKYDSVYLALEDKNYPESFEIDGKDVTKEEYEEKTGQYLKIGNDKIIWYDKNGEKVN